MTDAQLTILVTSIAALAGTIATAIRWAITRATTTLDRNAEAGMKALDRNTEAMLKQVESNAILATKIDMVASWVEDHTPPVGVPVPPPSKRTPAKGIAIVGGYGPMRPPTQRGGGDDE